MNCKTARYNEMKNNLLKIFAISLGSLLLTASGETEKGPAKINLIIYPDQVVNRIEEGIYGQFLEHIYHSLHGGLWGEVVWNRSFEETPSTHGNWLKAEMLSDWKFSGSSIKVSGENPRFIPVGSGAWRSYELSLRVRKTGGKGPVIVAVRHDRGSSLQLLLGDKIILRNISGQKKDTLAIVSSVAEPGKWYSICISYNNSVLRASIDDKLLLEAKTSAGREAGHFALGAENGGEGEFKDMIVTSPDGSVLFGGMPSPARHWQILGSGTELALDTINPLNSNLSMKIITQGKGEGICQKKFYLKKGDALSGSVWLKGKSSIGIEVRLRDGNKILAEQKIRISDESWKEYPLTLNPVTNADYASLEISASDKAVFWVDQVVLMPNSARQNGGFRPDLLKAVTDLQPASLRWPGGSFIGGFKWKNTIGPQSKRIGKTGWDDYDPLAFGVDEFISLCSKVGAEPVMVVNIGPRRNAPADTESLRDVCDLMEYCNGPATSKWGAVRASNGHPVPYKIKYWELDNEVWSTKPEVYASLVNEFATAMKKIDSSIILIACGSGSLGQNPGQWPVGDEVIVNNVTPLIDFISIHHYEGAGGYQTGPVKEEIFLNSLEEKIKRSPNPHIKIYLSEWNLGTTDWRTGLYAAGVLNNFERNSDNVPMACPALFLRHVSAPGWDNAFINFDNRTWFPAPNYVIMKLYRDNFAPLKIRHEGDPGEINVIASRLEDGSQVFVKIVNPSEDPVEMSLTVADGFGVDKASLTIVTADSLTARNTLNKPSVIAPRESTLTVKGNMISFSMPKFTAGVVKISKK